MRKFITLMAALVVAIVANAQVLVNYEHTADLPAGIEISGTTVMKSVKIHTNTDAVDCIQFANSYTADGKLNGNCAIITTDGGFQAGDVVEIAGFFNNADDTKTSAFVIYVEDDSESGYSVLWTSEKLINGRLVDDEPRVDTYVLEQDAQKLCIARSGNTGTNIYTLKITRGGAPAANAVTYGENSYEIVATETVNVKEWAGVAYSGKTADFSAQLAAMLQAVGLESCTTDQFIQVDANNAGFAFDTNDGWHGADGMIEGMGWGNEKGICVKPWNEDAIDGTISYIGCFDEAWTVGETHTCKYAVINDGKAAILEVVITFAEMPQISAPETDLSKITIVKEYAATLNFTEGKSFEGKTVAIDAPELSEVLGLDDETLIPNLRAATLTQEVVTDDNAGTVEYTNNLVNERDATDGWFGRYSSFDEATGEETFYVQNGLRSYGGGCTFYLQSPSIEEGQFTMIYGQYPNTMAAGAEDYAVIYVVNGDKAVKITYTVNVAEAEKVDFSQMTLAGEQTIDGSLEVASSYTSVAVEVNVADILEKLGAESADDLSEWILADEASLADPTTTDYWQGENGCAENWGDNACCQVKVDLANGTANLLQMPRYTEIAEPQTFPMHYIFTKGDKYYQLNFNFTLTPVKEITGDKECVSHEEFSMQIVPSADTWIYGETYKLDVDYIEKLIGTRNFTIYGDKWNAETETLDWSKKYTCYDGDEKGAGFWFGDKTYTNSKNEIVVDNQGWGENSFGFQLSALGVITWFQYPGQRSVGEEYKAHLYLVNEDNGKYIDYLINVVYVEEVSGEVKTVLETEDLAIVPSEQAKEGAFYLPILTDEIYEALGLTDETFNDAKIIAQKSKTMFYTTTIGETFGVNADGYYVSLDEPEGLNITATITTENGKPELFIDAMDLDFNSAETTAVVRFGVEYEGKRAIVEYTILGSETIGATDNSNGWWTAFSDFYTVKEGQLALVTFTNYSSKAENWNNWLFIAQKEGVLVNGAGADEYFALRADNYGWGTYYNASSLQNDYNWDTFKTDMDGAGVGVMITLKDGIIYSEALVQTTDRKLYHYSHNSLNIGADAFTFFFTTELGHMEDFHVHIADIDDPDAIVAPAAPAASAAPVAAPAGIYTVSGAKVDKLQKGINIVKMEDGSVKKIMVK